MAVQLVNGYALLPTPADWEQGAEILLQWQTGIALAQRGNEDRAGLRALPQAQMAWRVVTDTPMDGAALEDTIRAALRSGKACAPCYARPSYVDAVAYGGTQITLEATQWPWAAGDYLFAVDANLSTHIVQVQAVAGRQLTLATALPVVSLVWPLMFGRLEIEQPEQESPDTLTTNFRLYINQWKLPTASAALLGYAGNVMVPPVVVTDWSDSVARSWHYDAKPDQIGFGAEFLENEQSWVQHGVELTTVLRGDKAVSDVEAFVGVIGGRRGNFWLPAHERAMLVVAPLAGGSGFAIRGQGYADTWNNQPGVYLCFTRAGHAPMFGKVVNVVGGVQPGSEEVYLDAALPEQVDANWDVYRLRLMRLADDTLKEEYEADGVATLRLSVVEVPLEYGVALSTPQPAYLYRFLARMDSTVSWFLTSHAQSITYGGDTYAPASISHDEVKRTMESSDESVKLTSGYDPAGPLAAYLPFPPSDRFEVTIWRFDLLQPAVAAVQEFQGYISTVKLVGRKLEATVQCPIDFMDRKVPTYFIGYLCNVRLYGPGCNLNQADWKTTGNIAALAGTGIALAANPGKPQNYFAGGHLLVGAGLTKELRTIMASNGVSLVLNYPLLKAVVGQGVFIYPGCAHNPNDCMNKFDNWDNYQGHPLVPYKNPTLNAIDVAGSGGKK